ncbi:MAG: DCC1-like thiol-disulfide oxidoreductase family protein [Actinomycetota bacterium]|nr:DCC1-like thiol-disulfide oxidoreductase family protein [Actinomycetota bacterium]
MAPELQRRPRPSEVTVVYDGDCLLCRRSVRWLDGQRTVISVCTVAASDPVAAAQFEHLPNYGDDMIVATDDGRLWVGPPDAYLVVMWAIPKLRILSYLLSWGPLKPLVGRVFQLVTGNRQALGNLVFGGDGCIHCTPHR